MKCGHGHRPVKPEPLPLEAQDLGQIAGSAIGFGQVMENGPTSNTKKLDGKWTYASAWWPHEYLGYWTARQYEFCYDGSSYWQGPG